jgi:hypothetical protein
MSIAAIKNILTCHAADTPCNCTRTFSICFAGKGTQTELYWTLNVAKRHTVVMSRFWDKAASWWGKTVGNPVGFVFLLSLETDRQTRSGIWPNCDNMAAGTAEAF